MIQRLILGTCAITAVLGVGAGGWTAANVIEGAELSHVRRAAEPDGGLGARVR
ncbi:hypothetical protein [Nocardia vinacea]|uniref:hypothetical protein n=1 Tax=Nocardia vinacea TaxID=96468 RepID=UPI0002E4211F|nr:hypothetical protein [Nocardia vinacea]